MEPVWFVLVAVMIIAYVVLDGFDLGAGVLHLLIARTEEERVTVIRTIGSVWDGNEVWLIAGGGTLYFAFPLLYASSFSGFYLPLNIVLWLLVLRGIGIEFRMHIENRCGGRCSMDSLQYRARCWRSSSAQRSATWCAVSLWEWTIFSLSHCGRTSGLAPTPASSTGTPVGRRFLRLSLLWSTERFTWRSRRKER